MCSKTLHGMEVSEIGRWFDGSAREPFLKTGVIIALFQAEGTAPCSREDL